MELVEIAKSSTEDNIQRNLKGSFIDATNTPDSINNDENINNVNRADHKVKVLPNTTQHDTIAKTRFDRSIYEAKRKRKTNRLLSLLTIIFVVSWLPLNVFNLLIEVKAEFALGLHLIVVPACHIFVLCSACLNPLLYGWLNDNFRKEFVRLLSFCRCCCRSEVGKNPAVSTRVGVPSVSRLGQRQRDTIIE